jgi:hypothetical protein
MKRRIDSEDGRLQYGQRFATVEPVFGNIRHNTQLNRFTLRGQSKVDAQWKRYCLVRNIEKLANNGYAQQEKGRKACVLPFCHRCKICGQTNTVNDKTRI